MDRHRPVSFNREAKRVQHVEFNVEQCWMEMLNPFVWGENLSGLDGSGLCCRVLAQVAQAHYERSAYINLFFFAYIMSRQNIRVCMENATKTL